jgi:hypothetical protein
LLGGLLALSASLLAAAPASAVDQSYVSAIEQARSYVKEGLQGRSDAARQALAVLQPTVGESQPEILVDLHRDPPDYADADLRLAAVAAALGQPGELADPMQAATDLHRVLSQSRYAGLHAQDSLWTRFWNWVLTQFFEWLSSLQLGAVPSSIWFGLLAIASLLAAAAALLILRTGWTRAGRALEVARAARTERSIDRFAVADAAAARGDYAAALRSLVAGVATAVSGRPYWDQSPLTVRELFRSSGRLEQLRPLLADFELAVYGKRPVDQAAYLRAARLAEPFRLPAATPEAAA